MAEDMDVGSVGDEERELDLTESDVVNKYKLASDIANKTLTGLLTYAKPGMKVIDVCAFGDSLITQQAAMQFKSKKIEKGVAFPTCISLNDVVCHYNPLVSDSETMVLKEGDVVKVDLGVHIDGYITVAAHTFVLQSEGAPITGRTADVIKAAYIAAEAAVKLIKPGSTNSGVTNAINLVSKDFGVNSVQGVLMHQMKRFIIDGNQVVIQREEVEQRVEEFEFEDAKVYTVDVFMSTGEGKPIQRDARTTVFKRAVDQEYRLKMKASRYVFNEVNKRFATLPFTIRSFEDEKQARMGVVECVKHGLVTPYPVLQEKAGDIVAHFKYTVLLLPSGTLKVTGLPVNLEALQSDKSISPEVMEILNTSTKRNKKNKKKKKAAAEVDMETD